MNDKLLRPNGEIWTMDFGPFAVAPHCGAHVRLIPSLTNPLSGSFARISRIRAQVFSLACMMGAAILLRSTASNWLTSCLLAPVTTMDKGTPRSSTRIWRFVPFFPRSVGFAPELSLAKGALFMLPSMDCHSQATPSMSSYSDKPRCQSSKKKPSPSHSRKYLWVALGLPKTSFGKAFHWRPARKTYTMEENTLRGSMGFLPPPTYVYIAFPSLIWAWWSVVQRFPKRHRRLPGFYAHLRVFIGEKHNKNVTGEQFYLWRISKHCARDKR